MDTREAATLIGSAVPRGAATWADLGAGEGVFTRALVELLDPAGRIYAVDRDARAIAALRRWATREAPHVIPVVADFTEPFDLPGLEGPVVDGMLLANALHFVRDADQVLARLARMLRESGRIVLVEYERRRASRWVPFPIGPERLPDLATFAGLSTPVVTATRASAYGGNLYVAFADRLPGGGTR